MEDSTSPEQGGQTGESGRPALRRALSLPLVVLYGLGVTVGAGIYVLVGAAAAEAGVHAPLAFVVAAVVMLFSAASFSELATRFPVSAGEAAYVRAGFRSDKLSLLVGLMVAASGVVSSAAISIGGVGYIREIIDLPAPILIAIVVLFLASVAAWGVVESVLFAGLFTVVEVGALLLIVAIAPFERPDIIESLPEVLPPLSDIAALQGIAGAGLLAFFAFIGFEDIVNLAEEVKEPERTMPRAIFLTLLLGTGIYVLVAAVAVLAVPVEELSQSSAPLSLVFEWLTGMSPIAVTLVAIVATLNGVIVQIVMSSRVLYGLSRQGSLPGFLGQVNARTRTPLIATGLVAALVLTLALVFPIAILAEWTSRIILLTFSLVNISLLLVKRRGELPPQGAFRVPSWVPVVGAITSLGLLAADFLAG